MADQGFAAVLQDALESVLTCQRLRNLSTDPRQASSLGHCGLKAFVGALPIVDLGVHRVPPDDTAIGIAMGSQVYEKPVKDPIGSPDASFNLARLARFQQ